MYDCTYIPSVLARPKSVVSLFYNATTNKSNLNSVALSMALYLSKFLDVKVFTDDVDVRNRIIGR